MTVDRSLRPPEQSPTHADGSSRSEPPATSTARQHGRIESIEVLRGLSALVVVLFHYTGAMTLPVFRAMHAYGWLGVDVFFVISGFVIPYSLYGQSYRMRHFLPYMARRLVRLEPPYIASIVLVIVLAELSSRAPGFQGAPPEYSAPQVAAHLFYLVPVVGEKWLSAVYWSLAYEFAFYVLVGLTFGAVIKRPAMVTMASMLVILAVKYALVGWWDYRVVLFAPGFLAMRFVMGIDSRKAFLGWLALCLVIVASLAGGAEVGAVVIAIAGIVLLREQRFPRVFLWLGGISYSLYLTHTTIGGRVINLAGRAGDGAHVQVVAFVAALVISIAFAALFSWAVERPSTIASRSLARLRARREAH